jgi:ribonuclease HI
MMDSSVFQSAIVFTDGACSGNPGPGGWGAVVTLPTGRVFELGGRNASTTNNQMELTASLEALRALKDFEGSVILYTDSVYVIKGITQWIWGWIRNGWRTAEGKDVSNREIWQALSGAVAARKSKGPLHWKFVKGHSGNPGNERTDEIAVQFSKGQWVDLYDGSLLGYGVAIHDLPPDVPLPERSGPKTEKKAAHSYLSLLGGTAMRHSSWADCERRVKGQSGARFKKATSAADEETILRSWGVDPKSIKTS